MPLKKGLKQATVIDGIYLNQEPIVDIFQGIHCLSKNFLAWRQVSSSNFWANAQPIIIIIEATSQQDGIG